MKQKLVLIDIDGTLVTDDGYVPESAVKACKHAREQGHLLYLCTGRSKAEIYDYIWNIGFDGVIGAGGGYVQVGEDMLYHHKVPKEHVVHMVDFFDSHGVDFYLESNGGLYASQNFRPHIEQLIYGDVDHDEEARLRKETHPHPFIEEMIYDADCLYLDDVNKACFLESEQTSFEEIQQAFQGKFEVLRCTVPMFGEDSGELCIPGIHKAVAIEALLQHLHIAKKDTIAIGDGMNDVEMLQYCHIGIAMGNAKDGLKKIADDVCASVEEDGLQQALQQYLK